MMQIVIERIAYTVVEQHWDQDQRQIGDIPPAVKKEWSKNQKSFGSDNKALMQKIEIDKKSNRQKEKYKFVTIK